MSSAPRGALLFDFFGTLVDYQPDRARLAAIRAFELARSFGFGGDHAEFVARWDRASHALEAEARRTLVEFSMTDAARAFAADAHLDLEPAQHVDLGAVFVEEWAEHVHPVDGATAMLHRLTQSWTIGVVSNTHDPAMVPRLLDDMGLAEIVSVTVLSIDHGRLKPHPSIYETALAQLGVDATDAVFIGDSHEADYLGPSDLGVRALLIDPDDRHGVDEAHRLASVCDVEPMVAALDPPGA